MFDSTHFINTLIFIISVLGVFYHYLYSFLLLDLIIKIPLLNSVVRAIFQNRKQLFYTALLIFAVIYIYSFIAFIGFREGFFHDSDTGDS